MFGNPETTTGGRALKFYSSVRLDIRRIATIKDGDGGHRQPHPGQGRQEQGRPALQRGRVRHPLRRGHLARRASCIDLGVEHKIVEKSGTWFSYGDLRLGQGRENTKALLRDNADVALEIENKIREKLGIGPRRAAPLPSSRDRKPRKKKK